MRISSGWLSIRGRTRWSAPARSRWISMHSTPIRQPSITPVAGRRERVSRTRFGYAGAVRSYDCVVRSNPGLPRSRVAPTSFSTTLQGVLFSCVTEDPRGKHQRETALRARGSRPRWTSSRISVRPPVIASGHTWSGGRSTCYIRGADQDRGHLRGRIGRVFSDRPGPPARAVLHQPYCSFELEPQDGQRRRRSAPRVSDRAVGRASEKAEAIRA